ncbi:MAG: hypothetical protein N4A54_03930 [Peptostreptococcaceae bacterium]|jgi:hypothetical protein|nr:hypothetical protein [Peptostreptococcaceae bacterium]
MKFLKSKKKKENEVSEEKLEQQRREKTAQQWIPIADIEGNIVYRKDNILVGALRVQPENLNLLSDREKRRKVESLAEELNGERESLQIFCIGRPVDLNNYLEWLQEKAKMEQDFTRKQVLKGYIQQASQMAASGEITERRFYIMITKKYEKRAEEELMNRLNELQTKLSTAELTTNICKDDELMDLFCLFANPIQASFEKTEIRMDLPSILR